MIKPPTQIVMYQDSVADYEEWENRRMMDYDETLQKISIGLNKETDDEKYKS